MQMLSRDSLRVDPPPLNMVAIRQIGVSEEPLFWNYLFVDGHPDPNAWRAINSTRGIVRLLDSGPDGIPIEVPPRLW